jgi:anti-repressor protein
MELSILHDAQGRTCYSGREFFRFLGLHGDYNAWFEEMKKYGFSEGEHYTTVTRSARHHKKGRRTWKDHLITRPMADEICMVTATDEAHDARMELLAVWRAWQFEPVILYGRLTEMLEDSEVLDQLLMSISAQKDTASREAGERKSYSDLVREQKEPLTITQIANDFGLSAVMLNQILEDAGVQYRVYGTWRLRPDYADCGYVVKEAHGYHDNEGAHHERYRMKWTPAGRMFIYQMLKEAGIHPTMEVNEHA